MRDPYAFVQKRFGKHGPIFRSHLFGRKTAVIVGPDSATHFIDSALIERLGSQSPSTSFLQGRVCLTSMGPITALEKRLFCTPSHRRH
ncbi:hypothetical protein IV102_01080 [bacterium]|nr:hypothetical protein [bacterium]